MDLQPNQTLGQYRITQKIGEGGMGAVYKADQPSVPRAVVIKVLSSSFSEYADAGERFQRELKMITRLEHPHILPVYDYGEFEGRPYIVMRFMPGGSFQERLQARTMDRTSILHVLDQVAAALDFAHDQGIIHRDLKPANILLDDSGNAYLADFGLAKTVGGTHDLTATGTVLGSPTYISPEQARGEKLDRRSDIYSFAVLVFRSLSGRLPFVADDAWGYITKHLTEEPPSIRTVAPDLPAGLDAALKAGLAKDPAGRPGRASDLMAAVHAALSGSEEGTIATAYASGAPAGSISAVSGTSVAQAAPSVAAAPRRRSGRLPLILALAGIGLLVVGAIAVGGLYLASRQLGGPSLSTYPVGDQPRALLFDGQSIWVANYFDNTLTRLSATDCGSSPEDCGVEQGTIPVDGLPSALAFDGDRLWVTSSLDQTLAAIDPVSGSVLASHPLGHVPTSLLLVDSSVWIANDIAGTVSKVSDGGEILADTEVGEGPVALAFDGSSVWAILKGNRSLVRLNPATAAVEARIPLEGEPSAIAYDGSSLWVALRDSDRLARVNPLNPSDLNHLDLGVSPIALAYDGSSLWVAAPDAGKVLVVDPVGFRVTDSVSVPGFPVALEPVACGGECVDLWTANQSDDTVSRISIR